MLAAVRDVKLAPDIAPNDADQVPVVTVPTVVSADDVDAAVSIADPPTCAVPKIFVVDPDVEPMVIVVVEPAAPEVPMFTAFVPAEITPLAMLIVPINAVVLARLIVPVTLDFVF